MPGETLQERLRRLNRSGKRMPVADAIRFTLDICDAAGYAHRRGMIHRDIKPANIMLDVHDRAILMDFGIVKITGGEKHTATGAVVGTALYIPPELIRGETPDPRSDLYSLGVTLFEMVSGHPPFEADSAMTLMMMHLNDPVPDVHQLRPEVPEELISVITKSLSKDQNDRYSSMSGMTTALKAALPRVQAGITPQATLIEPQPEAKLPAAVQGAGATLIEDNPLPESPAARSEAAAVATARPALPDTDKMGSLPPNPPDGGTSAEGGSATPELSPALVASKLPAKKGAIGIAGAILLILLILGGIFAATRKPVVGSDKAAGLTAQPSATLLAAILPISTDTPAPSPTHTPTSLPTPTPTNAPTEAPTSTSTPIPPPTITPTPTLSPTPTSSPTPTIPPGVPFIRINVIALDIEGKYVVNYETFEYTEKLPGVHIHFFFNTVSPEQAGKPTGAGLWMIYGGPRPFSGFKQSDRPKNATQLCALAAKPDHSVQPNSGNCFNLPDVVQAVPVVDANCLLGPDPAFAVFTPLFAGQSVLVRGISPDENWWNIANPQNMAESCWLARDITTVSGDISTLGLIEPPPLPEGANSDAFTVEITQITIDAQNRYVVVFTTQGFTEKLPGMHLHFFFNNVTQDQVGITGAGNRLMYGGPSPFTGYSTSNRPQAATQLCVTVVNPDHSVILDSGNCMQLPDVPTP